MSTRPATNRLSFGFQRAEVIGAVTSVLVIWVLTGILLYEAVIRFMECLEPNPTVHVNGGLMFIVAAMGLLVNLVLMKVLGHGHCHGGHGHSHGGGSHGHSHGAGSHGHSHGEDVNHAHGDSSKSLHDDTVETHNHSHNHGLSPRGRSNRSHSHDDYSPCHADYQAHEERNDWVGGDLEIGLGEVSKPKKKNLENLNIRSAYIHALGDFIQSLGVCIAGGLIWLKPEWQIADPIATFIFSILVMGTTVGIIHDSVHVLMEGTPHGIDTKEIENGLQVCSTVNSVHDLHIWSLSAGLPSLSVHLVSDDADIALHEAQQYLMSKGITHTTIQVEKPSTKYPRDCKSDLKCGQIPTSRDNDQEHEASWI